MASANKTQSCSVANGIDRIDCASRDDHAEIDLPVLNLAVVDLENSTAMEGVRVVKARVTKRTSLPEVVFSSSRTKTLPAASVCDSGSDTDASDYNDMLQTPLPAG